METNVNFKCPTCGKEYKTKSGLWKHQKKCLPIENDVDSSSSRGDQDVEPSDEHISESESKHSDHIDSEENMEIPQISIKDMDIKKWNPQKIIDRYNDKAEPFIGLWYGMKESGKTTSIISILSKIREELDKIYIFTIAKSNKERYQKELGNIKDNDCFGGFDDPKTAKFIDKLIKFQELTKSKKRVLLLFDDIIDGKNALHQSKILGSLFANHRRYNISVVLATQIPTGISPITRQNCNYVFVHYTKNDSVKEMIYKDYLSCLERKEFQSLFENATRDHNILVIEPLLHDDYLSVYNSNWN